MSKVKHFLKLGGVIGLSAAMLIFYWPEQIVAETANGHLVISEVQISGAAASDDFIELYNPTDGPIDLKNYKIFKAASTGSISQMKSWTSSKIVQPRSYYLWVNSNYADLTELADEKNTSCSLAKNNAIALETKEGEILEAVSWDSAHDAFPGAFVFSGNINANQTLARVGTEDGVSFQLTAKPTPKAANEIVAPQVEEEAKPVSPIKIAPRVRIIEFLPNPEGLGDEGREWVKIVNESKNVEVNLEGWVVDDGGTLLPGSSSYKIGNIVLLPGETKTIIIPEGQFSLDNDLDLVRLFSADRALVDEVGFVNAPDNNVFAKSKDGSWSWQNVSSTQAFVSFSEVVSNPKGKDSGGEWLEITVSTSTPFDLSGWYLRQEDRSKYYQLPSGSIATSTYFVINLPSSFTLANTGGEVELLNGDKVPQAKVIFSEIAEGQSFAKDKENWRLAEPTPGQVNVFKAEEVMSGDVSHNNMTEELDLHNQPVNSTIKTVANALKTKKVTAPQPLAAATTKPVVSGASSQKSPLNNDKNDQVSDLPIIVADSQKGGFVHKTTHFLCKISFGLIKCP